MSTKRTVVQHPEGLKALQDAGCQYEWHQKTRPFTPLQKLGIERDGSVYKSDTMKGEDTKIRKVTKNIDIYLRGDYDKKAAKLATFPVHLMAYPTKFAKDMPAPKPEGKPISFKFDAKTGLASAQAPIQAKPVITKCKFEHLSANGDFKAAEAVITMLPPIDCTQVIHKFGEGPKAGKCFSDCDCDGARTCLENYTCSGTSRPACPKVDCKAFAAKQKTGCKLVPSKSMDIKTGCDMYPCGRARCPIAKPIVKCTLKTPSAPIKMKAGEAKNIDILQLGGDKKNMFAFRRVKKTFPEAIADCKQWGGHVASIHNQAENEKIVAKLEGLKENWWIGNKAAAKTDFANHVATKAAGDCTVIAAQEKGKWN